MLPRDKVLVTHCNGVFCNASTKAVAKLSALGFQVKEMLDGMNGWKTEGYPVEESIMKLSRQTVEWLPESSRFQSNPSLAVEEVFYDVDSKPRKQLGPLD
jgi:hypothetical protein